MRYYKRSIVAGATYYFTLNLQKQKKRERGVQPRRFWEHRIRDEEDYKQHVNYIYYNPVKHHYVSSHAKWPYSSMHRFIQMGILPVDWACSYKCNEGDWGNRNPLGKYWEPTLC